MPFAPMGVCLLPVLSLCTVAVLAVGPCDQAIIDNLMTKSSCYYRGVPPKQPAATSDLFTHVFITRGDLSTDTYCMTANQKDGQAHVTTFLKSGRQVQATFTDQQYTADHIKETDSAGTVYRLYVIHNKANVYSFYRCIESSKVRIAQSGSPMVAIAVGCKYVNDARAKAVVARAKECFNQLGIGNTIDVTPCKC